MAYPTVSVVIPCYNYAKYLQSALDSVLTQSVKAMEVIVVDDGSTDGSASIASDTAGVQLIQQVNAGHASACSTGFAASSGDWVIFLDADDFLMPTAIERAITSMLPGVSRVQWVLDVGDEDGQRTGRSMPRFENTAEDFAAVVLKEGPASYVCSPCSGNAWSREFLSNVMPLPRGYRYGMEPLLNDTCPLFGSVTTLANEHLTAYRRHQSSMAATRTWSEKALSAVTDELSERTEHLRAIASSRGLSVDVQSWQLRNWRRVVMATRLSRVGRGRPLRVLRPALGVLRTSGWDRKMAASIVAAVAARTLPLLLLDSVAARAIKLEYL